MSLTTGEETNADAIFRRKIREIVNHPFLQTQTKYPDLIDNCTLIEDILVYLSKEIPMDSTRAQKILDDAKKVLTYMDESGAAQELDLLHIKAQDEP